MRSREKSQLVFCCVSAIFITKSREERGEPSLTEAQVTFLFNFSFQIQPGAAVNRGGRAAPPLTEVTGGVKYSGREGGGAV